MLQLLRRPPFLFLLFADLMPFDDDWLSNMDAALVAAPAKKGFFDGSEFGSNAPMLDM